MNLLTSRKQEGWSRHARREPSISFAERFPPAESHHSMKEPPRIIHFLEHLCFLTAGTVLLTFPRGVARAQEGTVWSLTRLTPNHKKLHFPGGGLCRRQAETPATATVPGMAPVLQTLHELTHPGLCNGVRPNPLPCDNTCT